MIQQPELGKKIIDLRKAKGLTQEELVEKCNLSVRTLQRIEAGEVTPRPVTIKLIFEALEVPVDISEANKGLAVKWLTLFDDSFNLKTTTMKKISFVTLSILIIVLAIFMLSKGRKTHTPGELKKILDSRNEKIVFWFNNGMTDSITGLYSENACILADSKPNICGKAEISAHYAIQQSIGYRFIDKYTEAINVADSIAVERGVWIVQINPETRYKGKYLTEWHYIDGVWLIVNDIGCPEKKLNE